MKLLLFLTSAILSSSFIIPKFSAGNKRFHDSPTPIHAKARTSSTSPFLLPDPLQNAIGNFFENTLDGSMSFIQCYMLAIGYTVQRNLLTNHICYLIF